MSRPRRPRTSRIESVQQRAFEDALGEFFVYRKVDPDVGVDGQVEIFDGDETTGLTFDVQLKATDALDTARARKRLRIRNGHIEYWRSRQGPMLVVQYLGATKRLFARWLHSYDSYYDGSPTSRTTPLPMRDEDLLDESRRDRLASEIAAYRQLQGAALHLPLTMRIMAEAEFLSHAELLVALRSANRTPDVLHIDTAPGEANDVRFRVTDDRLAVELAGVTAATIHFERLEDLSADDAARNLLALTAIAFERVRQSNVAGRLAHVYLPESILAENADALMAIASVMVHARQIREALELSEKLDARDETSTHTHVLTLVPLVHAAGLSQDESDLFVETLRRRLQRRVARKDVLNAAREAVTLGNALRQRGEYTRSLAYLDKALRLDAGYAERVHFHEERGASLFFAGRYRDAAQAYERALELGAPRFTHALHADALLFDGRYADAADEFKAFLQEIEEGVRASEYVLKTVLCEQLLERGIRRQRRRVEEANRLADQAAKADDHEASRDAAEAGIAVDGLCALAWFNLAISLREMQRPEAATAWLCAAVTMEWDPDVWAEAIVTADIDPHMMLPLLLTARRLTHGGVFESLTRFARRNGLIDFLRRLPELIGSLPEEPEHPITIRNITEAGVESIHLPPRTTPT